MPYQIFIVEDFPPILSVYILLLKREADINVCGTAASGKEALTLIPKCRPDMVLMEINLPDISGFTVIKHLYQTDPQLIILIVSGNDPSAYSNFGAPSVKGFINKMEIECLIPTIREVLLETYQK